MKKSEWGKLHSGPVNFVAFVNFTPHWTFIRAGFAPLFSFCSGRQGVFSSSNPAVLLQDFWQWPWSSWWLLSGARWMVMWAHVPSGNRSSSPSLCYLPVSMTLEHPNLSVGLEGSDPSLRAGRPSEPSTQDFVQSRCEFILRMEILLILWVSGPEIGVKVMIKN